MNKNIGVVYKVLLLVGFLIGSIFFAPAIPTLAQGITYTYPVITNNFTPDVIPTSGTSVLTITLSNSNAFPITLSSYPPALSEPLPTGVFFANPVNATTDCGITVTTIGTTVAFYGGTIPVAAGENPGICTIKMNVTSTSAGSTFIYTIPVNELVATDPTGTIALTNQTKTDATLQVRTIQPPSLSKSFNQNTQTVGLTSRLSITIRNNDLNYPLNDVSVTDNFPTNVVTTATPGVTYTNCGSAPSSTDSSGGALGSGDTGIKLLNAVIPVNSSCVVSVNVTSITPGAYLNTIPANAVHTREAVTNSSAASAQVNFQKIDIGKSFSITNLQIGSTTKMSISLRNRTTDEDFTGVSLTDYLPAGLIPSADPQYFTDCGSGTVTYDSGLNSITLSGGTIARNTTCYITAYLTASVAGNYTNVVQAGALHTTQGASNVSAVSASLTTYSSGLGITSPSKSFSPAMIAVGGVSTLTISFTAPGDTDLSEFALTDALPSGVQVAVTPGATKSTYCQGGTFTPTTGGTVITYSGGTIPATRTCTLTVKVTGSTPGTYTNVIPPSNITNKENRTMSGNISASLTVSGISVFKAYYPQSVNINGVSTLTITLQNDNTSQLDNTHFADILLSGIQIVNASSAYTNCGLGATLNVAEGGHTIELSNGVIPASVGGVSGICTVVLNVKGITTGSYSNTIAVGDVTGTLHSSGLPLTNYNAPTATLNVAKLTVSVNKSFSPNTVFGGSSSTLTITLSNPNSTVLTGVGFTDTFPTGMYIAAPASPTTTCGGVVTAVPNNDSFTFAGGTMAANGTCIITVKTSMNVINTLTNSIPIGAITTTNGATNEEEVHASLGNLSLASLNKTFFDTSITASGTTTMQVKITNVGNVPLTGLGFLDTLPTGLTPVLPLSVSQCNGGTLSYDSGTNILSLTGGSLAGSASCTIQLDVTATTAGTYQNCLPAGTLTNDQHTTNPSETCSTLNVQPGVTLTPPAISKSFSPDPMVVGQTSALTFTITNSNSVALTGVAFTDIFPAGMVLANTPNSSQCGGSLTYTTDSITLTGGTIAAKAGSTNGSCTVVVGATAPAGINANTSSTVTSTNGGTGNTASDTLTVIAPPVISKKFNSDTITAGLTSTLTFTITNPNPAGNPVDLTGVSFTDNLPTGLIIAQTPGDVVTDCGATYTFTPSANDTSLAFNGGVVTTATPCVVSVDVTSLNGGSYINTTGNVNSTNGGPGNTATDTLTVNGPGLSLVKTHTTVSFHNADDAISYLYTLTNTGDVTISAPIMITDDHFALPFACTSTDLDPGASTSCTADYYATADDVTSKSITNIAEASGDAGGVTVASNKSSTTVPWASLKLTKTTSTVSFHNTGNSISYTYTLINNGNVTLYAPYVVTDDHFATPLTCPSTASLPVGAATTCTRSYSVKATDVTARFVTNDAVATAKDLGGNSVTSNHDSATVYKVDAPLISKIFSPDPIIAGGSSTLTFTITNPSANIVPLIGVAFSDTLPNGMTVVLPALTSQCGGTVTVDTNNTRVRLSGGSILAGSFCTVSVNVTVGTGGVYTNTSSTVSSTNGGTGLTAIDSLTAISPPAITKSFSPATINDGGTSTITFTITNPTGNPVSLTGVGFIDSFPDGLTVANPANVDISNCGLASVFLPSVGADTLTLSNANVVVGTPCVIKVDVTARAGTYPNTTDAITSTEGGDGQPSNTATLEVIPTLDLAITKTDGNLSVDRGEDLIYKIVVTNRGTIDATGAKVVDNVLSTLIGVTWTCEADTGAICSASGAGSINDTVNIPAGNKITYTVLGKVLDTATTDIVNTASVIPPVDLVDPNPDNNTQTDRDHVNSLEITKEVSAAHTDYLVLGETVTYTYTLSNSGTSTLSGPFMVTDDQIGTPAGTPFACSSATELLPDGTTTCTATYTITQPDLDNGSLTNTAFATGKDEDADTVKSNEAKQTIGAEQIPGIGLAKELISIEPVSTGTYDVTLKFLVKNYGNVTLHDISVADDLAATFTSLPLHEGTSFTVLSIDGNGTMIVNNAYNGQSDTALLGVGNSLTPDAQGTITIKVRVIPATHLYENSATATGLSPTNAPTTDISQNGDNPDLDGDGNPGNDNTPTPIEFGNKIFDPPTGEKTIDDTGRPLLAWNMVWINNSNIVGLHAAVSDPISEKTTFTSNGVDSGYPIPAGAPAGSTSLGVACTSSKATITTLCYYEGPTLPNYPRGRIVWEGIIGPDFKVTDPKKAVNALNISFNVTTIGNIYVVKNVATIDVDRNGDDDFNDAGESSALHVTKIWDVTPANLPKTGFAPNVVTQLSIQPLASQYADLGDLWLEIPSLNVKIPIVGIPQIGDSWDISWLGNKAGWLNGTAYPTWAGNSVITGHVYNSDGKPGPFINLFNLKYGDKIIMHAYGQQYIYDVREVKEVLSEDTSSVLKHEDLPWLTLVTCRDYDASTNTYRYRYIVRAVQVVIK